MAAEKIKIMKDNSHHSRGRENDGLTQAYKSYADYAFPKNETHHQLNKCSRLCSLYTN